MNNVNGVLDYFKLHLTPLHIFKTIFIYIILHFSAHLNTACRDAIVKNKRRGVNRNLF